LNSSFRTIGSWSLAGPPMIHLASTILLLSRTWVKKWSRVLNWLVRLHLKVQYFLCSKKVGCACIAHRCIIGTTLLLCLGAGLHRAQNISHWRPGGSVNCLSWHWYPYLY
jgi:hypothetical protein